MANKFINEKVQEICDVEESVQSDNDGDDDDDDDRIEVKLQ